MNFFNKIFYYIRLITVEPIGFLAFLSFVLQSTVEYKAMKLKMIKVYVDQSETEWYTSEKDVSVKVQEQIVHWTQYGYAANVPLAMIMTIAFGAMGDRSGRQINILLGLISLIWRLWFTMLVFTDSINCPLYLQVIGSFLTAFAGDYYIAYVSSQAFLADTIPDKELLTVRLNIVNVCRQIGLILGSTVVGELGEILGFSRTMLIAMVSTTCAILYTIIRIPQIPPKTMASRQRRITLHSVHISDDELPPYMDKPELIDKFEEPKFSLGKWLNEKSYLFRDTWRTFTKKREGHRRFFIISIALLQFVASLSSTEAFKLVALYTLRSKSEGGLDWGPTELGQWSAVGIALGMIGSLGGTFLFTKVLHFRDTTVCTIGLISQTLNVIPIANAKYNWHMYLASVFGMFYGLTSPTLGSFVASLVPLNELGKVYTAFAMTGFVSSLLQMFVLQEIYLATLDWYPPFMWYFVGLLSFICVIVMIIIHFMSKRERIGEQISAFNELNTDKTE